ncbi:copper homeostasis protein CutC [Desemzia incerta]|uniref:copper homeostasis protein CutC n=1 Tax=Desemzia incerta TaxID=82801 RepID=UPI0024C2A94C|nr:copper homeostasis protein CutC [Desemzia incerta]WHZ32794.1 copper homeostasis protein CutC [Desemzia incerta]
MIREVCVENFTLVPNAIQAGADRIELCDNLAVGGTTVSVGVMEATITYCKQEAVPVMVIIRPRGGNFVYSKAEKDIMLRDIQTAKELGAEGIVIGALTTDYTLDTDFLTKVIQVSENMERTFHMAFDELSKEQQRAAIDWLSEAGYSRILTHGGPLTDPIDQHTTTLKELIAYSKGRITILPGGGITSDNASRLQKELLIEELHGTKIVGTLE